MDTYCAPIAAMMHALRTVGIEELLALPAYKDLDLDSIREVLGGFAQLAEEKIAPTDSIGDRVGAALDRVTGGVSVPGEFRTALAAYIDGGWLGVSAPAEHGGGGFPGAVGLAVHEMFGSANMSLSLNPMLTQSAIELLQRWGDERQQSVVLPRLIDGTWSGTMNLTEADSGSDLGTVRTQAVERDDGTFLINGTKIFITWGEHDLVDNIVHLVLARTPGADVGTRGLSLFLVPRSIIGADGRLGERNGVHCRALEHKLGIHASPTCVLEFVDAVGELVGPLHGGMVGMFSMMNPARLAVGVQGVSIAERAFQQAFEYAQQRQQGHTANGPAVLLDHPDVQRMLLDIASTRDAMRLLTFATSIAGDLARHHPDAEVRECHQRRVDLLTPLAKAWPTDQGVRLASLALQVFGGAGFIEESGIAQRYRDAKITTIYEGTNGIQAIDLIARKLASDDGAALEVLLREIDGTIEKATQDLELHTVASQLAASVADTRAATSWVLEQLPRDRDAVLGGACAYLELVAVTCAGDLMVRRAMLAKASSPSEATRALRRCEFFAVQHLQQRPTFGAVSVGTIALRAGLD